MMLEAEGLGKAFDGQTVLNGVNLRVRSGETLAVVGRSGCGKTTLLRLLAGFIQPDAGRVLLDGQAVTAPDSDRLMVFQSFDQLFPWYTLEQNVRFALAKTRPTLGKKEARAVAAQCLAEMGLFEAAQKYPYQLSGGMKQRGAMARAMAISPKALLLDEPFSSLDVVSREAARQALGTLRAATGAAVVLVTHDLREAASLATHIALMKAESKGIFRTMANEGERVAEMLEGLI